MTYIPKLIRCILQLASLENAAMPSLALARPSLQRPPIMANPVDTTGLDADARELGRALTVLRKRAGLNQEGAGERIGTSGQAWAKYENGRAPGIHNPATQRRLTGALGFEPEDLLRERQIIRSGGKSNVIDLGAWTQNAATSTLPIRDRVQAGAWLMADDSSQVEPRRHSFARDPRFPHADQWLSEIFGDSVDRLGIFDGDLVHCVDFEGAGVALQSGQIVEIERLRFGGQERELSIKQVELTPQGPLLWPRSSNPRWQTPLSMTSDAGNDEVLVRLRGLVVQSIRRF